MRARFALLGLALSVAAVACGGGGGEGGPAVSFGAPEDGATVASPVDLQFEAENLQVEEAGEVNEGAGHFHVLVDTECVAAGEPIPDDESHLHFGDASTSTQVELEPGEHTLCLQAGDGAHTALDATDEITITVE